MTYATVIAGVDGTRAGFEAARQAAALVDEGGRLLLVAIEDGWDVLAGRWGGVTFAWFENGTAWPLERRLRQYRPVVAESDIRSEKVLPRKRRRELRRPKFQLRAQAV